MSILLSLARLAQHPRPARQVTQTVALVKMSRTLSIARSDNRRLTLSHTFLREGGQMILSTVDQTCTAHKMHMSTVLLIRDYRQSEAMAAI